MLRVALKLLLAAAAVAAVWSFVPVGGHTMADRWRRAGSVPALVDRTWAELHGAPARPVHPTRPAPVPRVQARSGASAPRPTESHSEADRRALERTLSSHLEEQ